MWQCYIYSLAGRLVLPEVVGVVIVPAASCHIGEVNQPAQAAIIPAGNLLATALLDTAQLALLVQLFMFQRCLIYPHPTKTWHTADETRPLLPQKMATPKHQLLSS